MQHTSPHHTGMHALNVQITHKHVHAQMRALRHAWQTNTPNGIVYITSVELLQCLIQLVITVRYNVLDHVSTLLDHMTHWGYQISALIEVLRQHHLHTYATWDTFTPRVHTCSVSSYSTAVLVTTSWPLSCKCLLHFLLMIINTLFPVFYKRQHHSSQHSYGLPSCWPIS